MTSELPLVLAKSSLQEALLLQVNGAFIAHQCVAYHRQRRRVCVVGTDEKLDLRGDAGAVGRLKGLGDESLEVDLKGAHAARRSPQEASTHGMLHARAEQAACIAASASRQ
jgi:hypothetical protein